MSLKIGFKSPKVTCIPWHLTLAERHTKQHLEVKSKKLEKLPYYYDSLPLSVELVHLGLIWVYLQSAALCCVEIFSDTLKT